MHKLGMWVGFFTAILLFTSLPLSALQISQIEFDLHLSPKTSKNYSFLVINDETRPQKITVYLNDWVRSPQGKNYFSPLNSVLWLFSRQFAPGDVFTITYRVLPPFAGVTVNGGYTTDSPAASGKIAGPSTLSGTGPTASVPAAGPVEITRVISPSPTVPGAQRVQLTVHVLKAVTGMRINEVFSQHVTVKSVNAAGGKFTTFARSNGRWITVTPQKFTIAPGKRQQVSFTVHVPKKGVSGMYWGAIMVRGSPWAVQQHGTTVLAVEEFGVKVYVTISGTEVKSGRVTDVREIAPKPLTFTVTFENTGNVQLRPKGSLKIISQTGETVRTIPIEEFPVLPDATRVLTVSDSSKSPLPPGRYLALATVDFGNPNYLAAGRLPFVVKELHLIPIGNSANPPRDLDGDGLYEDINGDGKLTIEDPILLSFYIDSPAAQENARAFDFNHDGVVNFNDVIALKAMVKK